MRGLIACERKGLYVPVHRLAPAAGVAPLGDEPAVAFASGALSRAHDMGICTFTPAPISGYLAAADGSQATWSGSAHVRMAVPRHLTGGMGALGELVPRPTGRPGNWLGR